MHALAAAISVSAAALLGAATAHAAPTTQPSTSQPGVTDPSAAPTTSQPGVTVPTPPSTPPSTSQPGVTDPSAPAPTTPAPLQAPLAVPGGEAAVPAAPAATDPAQESALAAESAPAEQPATVWIDPDDMPRAHQAPVAPALPVPKPVVEVNAAADTLVGAVPMAVNGRQYGNPEGYVGTIGWRVGEATGTAGIAVDPSSPTAATVSAFSADSDAEHPTNWSAPVDVTPVAAAISAAADRYPAFGQLVETIASLPAPQLPQLQSTDSGPASTTIGGVNVRSQATLHV
ncbi:glycoprotein [Rhodococcus sp. 4CII]|uniref:glycoprotein n=2 Tax=unclassified Rhodococcus (in: high G+C Gram-positive bacteria) TaxID=192944 RepID=UPI00163ACC22|nr:glycoprotein [Rhodococcus sp. 4CII]MBC2641121.1 glycoprotein [Rhodococcus sp. 3A]MBC2894134.1 glycoprotein [Rhodococcus sp. 4CII]